MAILGAILAIGFLVLVHEAGHYLVARWCGMRVERFSVGFGPAIWSKPRRYDVLSEVGGEVDDCTNSLYKLARKRPRGRAGVEVGDERLEWTAAQLASLPLQQVRGQIKELLDKHSGTEATVSAWEQTDFTLAPIPFGGFVQIDGMALAEDVDPDDAAAYPNKPVWQRAATIFAGPATNYVTAVVLALGLYSIAGVPTGVFEVTVESFVDGYDAKTKLEKGDRIVRVNGEQMTDDNGGLPEMVQKAKGTPITITVVRNGKTLDVDLVAKPAKLGFYASLFKRYHEETGQDWKTQYLIGIGMTSHPLRKSIGIATSVKESLAYPVRQTEVILVGLWKIISREEKPVVGGPVMITSMIKSSIDYGWTSLVMMLMLLNVYLGLFNLLPLPALDGGRLAFLGYEIVTRRRPNPSVEQTVHAVGIMAFLVIMVLVTYKDILRLLS